MRNERKAKRLTKEAKQLLLLIGGVVVLVAVVIGITVAVFYSKNPKNPAADSADPQDSSLVTSSGLTVEENDYDPEKNVLEVDKYVGTILPATEDAGEEYLDETLFIGDSNTYRYMTYAHTSLKNTIGVPGMGIQNVLTEKCVKFKGYSDRVTIPEAVKIMQPKRIIIGFGTNNANGDWSPEYMAEQYGKMLDGIEAQWPYADIIIAAIPPVARVRDGYQNISMSVIDAYNQALVGLAEERGCKFLNTTEVLKDPETGFTMEGYTITDGIHLAKPAVDALFGYIRTHAYETEDRRPTPLKTVPARDEPEPYNILVENPYTGTVAGSGSSVKDGLQIDFDVNDAKMGELKGEVKQIVPGGEKCTEVEAVAKEGYTFAYWSCTVGRIEDVKDPKLTFVSPAGFDTERVVVTANFVKSGYLVKVTSSDAEVGTAGIRKGNELRKEINVEEGEEVKLYASLNEGYGGTHQFAGWYIKDSETNEPISTAKEFTYKPEDSVEIVARFEQIPWQISVSTDGSAGCKYTHVSSNGKLSVTAIPGSGFEFDYWTVNGKDQYGANPLELNINQNLTVVIHFKAVNSGGSSSDSSSTGGSSSDSSSTGGSSSDSSSTGGSSSESSSTGGSSSDSESHTHSWTGGNCNTKQTCSCGAQGDVVPDAHSWTGGNCVTRQTCSNGCGAEGSVVPDAHSWTGGSCTARQTCANGCGAEGSFVHAGTMVDGTYCDQCLPASSSTESVSEPGNPAPEPGAEG